MKCFILAVMFLPLLAYPQKPDIDFESFKNWPTIQNVSISRDGKYSKYEIQTSSDNNKLIVRSTNPKYNYSIRCEKNSSLFARNSDDLVFLRGDSICILNLDDTVLKFISPAKSYSLTRKGEEWLFYRKSTQIKDLILLNLQSGIEKQYQHVNNYQISEDGKTLLLIKDNDNGQMLEVVSLISNDIQLVWEGKRIYDVKMDINCSQLAFLVQGSGEEPKKELWYYSMKSKICKPLEGINSFEKENGLQVKSIRNFSNDNNRIFFTVSEANSQKPPESQLHLNVWSYFDPSLQSYQLRNYSPSEYLVVYNINTRQLLRLEQKNEMITINKSNDSVGIVSVSLKGGGEIDGSELHWSEFGKKNAYLISTSTGNISQLKGLLGNYRTKRFLSPNSDFIIYYDWNERNYFSYEIATKKIRNLTQNILTTWSMYGDDHINSQSQSYNVVGWLQNEDGVLLHDQYDVWLVDVMGKRKSINITNGYGKRNNIFFELINSNSSNIIDTSEKLILSAFNLVNKKNGFFSKGVYEKGDPELLTMENYFYYAPTAAVRAPDGVNFKPLKALTSNVYVVRRMNPTQFPNYYLTNDFKKFDSITDYHPEKNYNWYTTELINWNTKGGDKLQGVLYKPENFDDKKKYPVIIHYYETKGNGLNAYLRPNVCEGDINIPWFVSKGYLVFEPDIIFQKGNPGESVLDAVTSGINKLASRKYIDLTKIGIQGNSWGGYETNYLVTHSNLFAAAASCSGLSDMVSHYGSLIEGGYSLQEYHELGQTRIGATLWEKPELFIKNSPVFAANNMATPLLMFHTTKDGVYQFSQAIEFFTALRRLKKIVWMLEYEDGNHGVSGKDAIDFTIRLTQFFNHYLKSAPAPIWMSQGIPAKLKGIQTGYPLNPTGNCGTKQNPCKICTSWNTKMKTNPTTTLQEIETRKLQEHWE